MFEQILNQEVPTMTIQQLIEKKMKMAGMKSWNDLANKSGVDSGGLSRFRHGARGIHAKSLVMILAALRNISMQELIEAKWE